MKVENRVAIVTGASRGMGKEIALAFAREGANLVLGARTVTEATASSDPESIGAPVLGSRISAYRRPSMAMYLA